MARFKSNIFTSIHGKLGGNVFSKNGSGLVVRSRRTANSVYTQPRLEANSNFAYTSSFWRGLSEPQQESWHEASEGKGGFQLFKKCNANRLLIGQSLLSEPLEKPSIPTPTASAVVFSPVPKVWVIGVSVLFDISVNGLVAIAKATGPISAGIKNPTGTNFRLIGSQQSDSGFIPLVEFNQAWQARYGNPSNYIGLIIGMSVKVIDIESGYGTKYIKVIGQI